MPSYSVRSIKGHFYLYLSDPLKTPKRKSWPLGTGIKQKRRADTEAKRLFEEYLDGIFDPWTAKHVPKERPLLLEEALQRFLEAHPHHRPKTREAYSGAVKGLSRCVPPGTTLVLIDSAHVRNYVESPDVSDATRATRYRHLKAFFKWAAAQRHVVRSPVDALRAPKKSLKEAAFLTRAEVGHLMTTLESKEAQGRPLRWLRDTISMALFTGMRRGELCALRWRDVDLDNGFITVRSDASFRTKSGHERRVPIVPNLKELLVEMRTTRATGGPIDRSAFVLLGVQGHQLNGEFASHAFKKLIREAGLPDEVHFHSLRHTCASWMVISGVSLTVVGRILGHASNEVTQRYAHLAPDNIRQGLERAFGSQ